MDKDSCAQAKIRADRWSDSKADRKWWMTERLTIQAVRTTAGQHVARDYLLVALPPWAPVKQRPLLAIE